MMSTLGMSKDLINEVWGVSRNVKLKDGYWDHVAFFCWRYPLVEAFTETLD